MVNIVLKVFKVNRRDIRMMWLDIFNCAFVVRFEDVQYNMQPIVIAFVLTICNMWFRGVLEPC